MNTLPRVMTVLGIFGFDANAIDVSGQSQNVAQPMMSSWMHNDFVYAYNANNLPHGCYLNDDKISVRGCGLNLDRTDVLFNLDKKCGMRLIEAAREAAQVRCGTKKIKREHVMIPYKKYGFYCGK